jgi:hypothetical protein
VRLQNLVTFVVRVHAGIDRDRLCVDQEIKEAPNEFRARIRRALEAGASQGRQIRPPNYPPRIRTHGIQFHQPC